MPRRPSRYRNSNRPTRDDLASRLDEVEEEQHADVEEGLTLVELLSYELERVDEERGIVRLVETGELRRYDPDEQFSIDVSSQGVSN